jgi:hypothetical protein
MQVLEPETPSSVIDAAPMAEAQAVEVKIAKREISRERFFTEGELLPWKGRWFRAHLSNETNRIELELVKHTDREKMLEARSARWLAQHPRATHTRNGTQLLVTAVA